MLSAYKFASLFVLATSAFALVAKRDFTDGEVCNYVVTPADGAVVDDNTNLVAEINFVFGRALADATNGGIFNFGSTAEFDGQTISGAIRLSADDLSDADVGTVLEGFLGQTLTGPSFDVVVQSIDCA